jgi:hypothetical protein
MRPTSSLRGKDAEVAFGDKSSEILECVGHEHTVTIVHIVERCCNMQSRVEHARRQRRRNSMELHG